MKVLVCGGAGYVGPHMVQLLAEHGYSAVTFDNLSAGPLGAAKRVTGRNIEFEALRVRIQFPNAMNACPVPMFAGRHAH